MNMIPAKLKHKFQVIKFSISNFLKDERARSSPNDGANISFNGPENHAASLTNTKRTRLEFTANEIRILNLLPGSGDDDIKCDLRVVALGDSGSYEALSYVWGEMVDEKVIKVDGREIQITPNLYAAFVRLRHPTQIRALWVDQLCINQWDKQEKAEQVMLMRLIYKNCSQCLIWLGEVNEGAGFSVRDADVALDFIRIVAAGNTDGVTEQIPAMLVDSDEGEKSRTAFRAMVMHGNVWWSRIWTVQETVLPPSATVVWGPLTIPWELLARAAENMCRDGRLSITVMQAVNRYDNLIENFMYPVRGLEISRSGEGPLNLLQRWRYRNATDPLDKVYALLGLFPRTPFPSLQSCSYILSPATLYTIVTLDIIRHERCLRPLIGFRGEPHVTTALPTWAMDLTCFDYGNRKRPWKWWNHSHRYKEFAASGSQPFEFSSLYDNTVLSLRGVLVDRIVEVGDVLGEGTWENLTDDQLADTISRWAQLFNRFVESRETGDAYIRGGNWPDAFCKTMVGDLVMAEFPVGRVGDACQLKILQFLNHRKKSDIYQSLCDMVVNQAFFITECGYIGIAPPNVQINDEVWVLFGGRVPFVLRSRENGSRTSQGCGEANEYLFIGDAYVHGIMDGEIVEEYDGNEASILIF